MAMAKDLTAGTLAGAAQLIVGHPFDTIKVKLQTQPVAPPGHTPLFAGAIDAAKKTMGAEGVWGLYKGMGAPLATVALLNAVLFSARGQMEALMEAAPGDHLSVKQQMVAGAGAGAAVSFAECPTELVKCRLQAQSALPKDAGLGFPCGTATTTATGAVLPIQHKGPMEVTIHILRSEGGVLGLFKGLTPTLLREVPGNAAMFGAYEALKQAMAGGRDTSQLGRGSLLTAGGIAGAVFWLAVYPTDVIKSVIQVDSYRNPKYTGTIDAFRQVYAAEGVKGLYRGFGPAIARSIPANAACFLTYEIVRSSLG